MRPSFSGLFHFGILIGVAIVCGIIMLTDPAVCLLHRVSVAVALTMMAFSIVGCQQSLERFERRRGN